MKVELKDIELPTMWEDVDGEMLEKLLNIQTDKRENVDIVRDYIAIVADIPQEFVKHIDGDIINKIYPKISFLFDKNPEGASTNFTLQIEGVEYAIFNEDVVTVGEWLETVGIESFTKGIQNLSTVLPVFIRPIKEKVGDKYLLEEYNADKALVYSSELLKAITAPQVYAVMGFFLTIEKELLKNTQVSLTQEVEKLQISQKNGGGTTQSGNSLKKEHMELLEKLKKLELKKL